MEGRGMRTQDAALAAAVLLMVAGWAYGGMVQLGTDLSTGYTGISEPQILIGLALCIGGGVVGRLWWGSSRFGRAPRLRWGAAAGVLAAAWVIGSKLLLEFAIADRLEPGESGETPFSLLLEAWFWLGLPLVVSAILGALGWAATDLLLRHGPTRGGSASA